MAPRAKKAAAAKSPGVKKVAAENGKVTKAKKPAAAAKKLTTPVKKSVKAAATETKAKAAKTTPAKKAGPIDAYLLFEVCKSCQTYKRTANQIFSDISAQFPKKRFEIVINDHGLSRRGSFEITVSKKKGGSSNATLIWSGIKKGPPRKLKFPESAQLFESVKSAL